MTREWPVQFRRLDRDDIDAEGIRQTLIGLNTLRSGRRDGGVGRQARSLIQSIWEEPRLHGHRVARIRPVNIPWSPGARRMFFAGLHNGNLVLEHLTPMRLYVIDVMSRVESGELADGPAMLAYLRSTHETRPVFTVVSKNEDVAVSKAGFKECLPENGDPWSRYAAAGLAESDFCLMSEDERYVTSPS